MMRAGIEARVTEGVHLLACSLGVAAVCSVVVACQGETREATTGTTPASAVASQAVRSAAPQISTPTVVTPKRAPVPRCPADMVYVWFDGSAATGGDPGASGGVCVDRYEASLVHHQTGARISPYYPPAAKGVRTVLRIWKRRRLQIGSGKARAVPLPSVASWQTKGEYEPRAVVRRGATPNGHVTGTLAQIACQRAGKRTCNRREWRRACGGEQGWAFPYGPRYEQGACNVFREAHPAAVLHDDASRGHSDPRLNRVTSKGRPLLRKGGASPRCVSHWGRDGIYDMVGNVDEWLDEPTGTFAGGFYARGTKEGCEWFGGAHSIHYGDYSTGVRCCKDATQPPG